MDFTDRVARIKEKHAERPPAPPSAGLQNTAFAPSTGTQPGLNGSAGIDESLPRPSLEGLSAARGSYEPRTKSRASKFATNLLMSLVVFCGIMGGTVLYLKSLMADFEVQNTPLTPTVQTPSDQ